MTEPNQKTTHHNPSQVETIDMLFKVINRFDFYTNSTNVKTSLIIAWNSFIFGTILMKYDDILTLFPPIGWPHYISIFFVSLFGIFSIISNIFAFQVALPFLQPSSINLSSSSMFFFGSVSKKSVEDYSVEIGGASFEFILSDLCDQAVTVARGLSEKMAKLQNSIQAIYGGLIAASGLLILKAIVSV